ncbi:MAG: hybrid sensor histidine kinase/response regulator [Flavobacteriales bacterium]|nr:hybrid sensor histidine kinase/response regulator [Flavobacteriales bacterium]
MNDEVADIVINPSDYKILIVDDVDSNVILLKALLKSSGYQIFTANCGELALASVNQNKPDLVLLDIMMPDVDGFEVARRLKDDPKTKNIPIVFLSALDDTESIVKGFKVGGADFVTKPFKQDELRTRIRHQITLIATTRVIIEQREMLRQTLNSRDKMYSVIAHDLRGPMGSLKMILNLLVLSLDKEKVGKDMFEMLDMANETTEGLFDLLDNLLKWTKSQQNRINVAFQEHDIVGLIHSTVEISNTVAMLKNINISINSQEKEMTVYADSDLIKTIVRNFLSNAIKFSYPNSTIEVNLSQDEDFVIVDVADHGKGIAEKDQGKLLKNEGKFTTYGTGNEEGSGLGLLLCQDFAEKNNGRMWFKSKEGEGSTFSFSVPKRKTE